MKKLKSRVVVFWADEPQFMALSNGSGYEEKIEAFIRSCLASLIALNGDDWDCTMLAKMCRSAELRVTNAIPTDDEFTAIYLK